MAIRVRAQLRKWFGRGMYPTAEQFSDLFDSFFHKTEDKIPMSGVEGLTDQLNGKYSTAEGRELEKKVQKVTTDLSAHVASSEKAFNEVQNDIESAVERLDVAGLRSVIVGKALYEGRITLEELKRCLPNA